jgi:putative N6-adenine-specific DNA methylase
LVIVNPPYGNRIGDKKQLCSLYPALGQTLTSCFVGWRVGLLTSEVTLARATRLPIRESAVSVSHRGMRVSLYLAGALT